MDGSPVEVDVSQASGDSGSRLGGVPVHMEEASFESAVYLGGKVYECTKISEIKEINTEFEIP